MPKYQYGYLYRAYGEPPNQVTYILQTTNEAKCVVSGTSELAAFEILGAEGWKLTDRFDEYGLNASLPVPGSQGTVFGSEPDDDLEALHRPVAIEYARIHPEAERWAFDKQFVYREIE
ncbi:hypothetical protein ACIQWZ_40220 [Streptomyces sp. NPDC098077]|uniref:hypothetical protein n=1 Tax=Streptomyces sp. NPDC098077 TaxID=3366093 RepID=UPI0037F93F93